MTSRWKMYLERTSTTRSQSYRHRRFVQTDLWYNKEAEIRSHDGRISHSPSNIPKVGDQDQSEWWVTIYILLFSSISWIVIHVKQDSKDKKKPIFLIEHISWSWQTKKINHVIFATPLRCKMKNRFEPNRSPPRCIRNVIFNHQYIRLDRYIKLIYIHFNIFSWYPHATSVLKNKWG